MTASHTEASTPLGLHERRGAAAGAALGRRGAQRVGHAEPAARPARTRRR